jgi:hypothetical protein
MPENSSYITGQRSIALVVNERQGDESQPENVAPFRAIVSSETPVDIIAYIEGKERVVQEVLVHEGGEIDTSAMRAVLFGHDRHFILGSILDIRQAGQQLDAGFSIREEVTLPGGTKATDAVRDGSLAGVSLMYRYKMSDATYDPTSNQLRVNKWRAMELTLTPVPEDTAAFVYQRAAAINQERPQIQTIKEQTMPDKANTTDEGQRDAGQVAPVTATTDTQENEGQRSADVAIIVAEAEKLGLRASQYIGMDLAGARSKMIDDTAAVLSQRHSQPTGAPIPVQFGADEVSKGRAAADEYFFVRSHRREAKGENPLLGRWRLRDAAKTYAKMIGLRGADDWSDSDAARFALGDYRNMSERARSAANISTASFPSFVNANIVTKIVADGFSQADDSITFPLWTRQRDVPDFKQYTYGNLGTGNLQETDENEAFPELLKSEGFYNSRVRKWGGTLSLSIEALINDDVGLFFESLSMAGAIARKTKERRCYERLLATAQWSDNTTAGDIRHDTADKSYEARQKLDAVIAAMMTKKGLDGNPLNNPPRFLLAPSALAGQAEAIVGGVAPGQQANQSGRRRALEVVESAWLSASTLTGNSATSYYLIADPASVRGMTEVVLSAFPGIVVEEYDAGSVAARNWKMWHAFEFDLPKLGNVIAGAHRGTAA